MHDTLIYFKGWRTVIVNALLAILPILELVEVQHVLPTEWLRWYLLGVVLINMWLRGVTTTPIGERG